MGGSMDGFIGFVLFMAVIIVVASIRVIDQFERGVVLTLGRIWEFASQAYGSSYQSSKR